MSKLFIDIKINTLAVTPHVCYQTELSQILTHSNKQNLNCSVNIPHHIEGLVNHRTHLVMLH